MVRSHFLVFLAFLALVGSDLVETDSNIFQIDSNLFDDIHSNDVDPDSNDFDADSNIVKIQVSTSDEDVYMAMLSENYADLEPSNGFMDIIGFAGQLIKIYDTITQPSTGDLQAQIREGFKRVEHQLADIQETLHNIIGIIQDQAIRTQYAGSEGYITESIRCYNNYLTMTTQEGKDYWRKEFLQNGGELRKSVSFLLDGMLGRNIFAGDILDSVVTAERYGAGRVKSRIDNFMGLINSGIWIHAAYVKEYPISNETNAPFHSLVESSYAEIVNRVQVQIAECENEATVPKQMTKLMKANSGQKPKEFIKTLYHYLSDRYDTKYWFVVVYEPLTGFDNHCVSGYFHYVFRQGKKNAVATSFPKGRKYRFDEAQKKFLKHFACNNYSNAEKAWNAINKGAGPCGAAAIGRKGYAWGIWDSHIQVSWKNCRYLTTIAIPGRVIEFDNQAQAMKMS